MLPVTPLLPFDVICMGLPDNDYYSQKVNKLVYKIKEFITRVGMTVDR